MRLEPTTPESEIEALAWDKQDGLLPAIVQDASNRRVLMLGYMDRKALATTLAGGKVTFFSRSKGRLWTKGESSGHYLALVAIEADCDRDTLLVQALPQGPTCHLGTASCFPQAPGDFLAELDALIATRERQRPPRSYTTRLLEAGVVKIAQKVGEEGVETALAGAAQTMWRCSRRVRTCSTTCWCCCGPGGSRSPMSSGNCAGATTIDAGMAVGGLAGTRLSDSPGAGPAARCPGRPRARRRVPPPRRKGTRPAPPARPGPATMRSVAARLRACRRLRCRTSPRPFRPQVAGVGMAEEQLLRRHRAGRVDADRVPRGVPRLRSRLDGIGVDVRREIRLPVAVLPHHALQRLERRVLAVLVDPALQGLDDHLVAADAADFGRHLVQPAPDLRLVAVRIATKAGQAARRAYGNSTSFTNEMLDWWCLRCR
jgi:phosphoribosyl-AMP cyclohydrolase / phosphoribosyl-ATP pyrophosphohydrolase